MAVEVLEIRDYDGGPKGFVFHCNNAGLVFGPVMDDHEIAEEFLTHCRKAHGDPRHIAPRTLSIFYAAFNRARESVKGT